MKLSNGTIEQLKPIIEQIDKELEKDQEDRISFRIYSNKVPTLKTSLATYKSLYKREEWNGKFWMHKKKNKETDETFLEVDFTPRTAMNFVIQQLGVNITEPKDGITIVANNDAPHPGDGAALEMDDKQATMYILQESPRVVQFLISSLSVATQQYLADRKNAEPSALINLLQRNDYNISVVMGTRLRVYK